MRSPLQARVPCLLLLAMSAVSFAQMAPRAREIISLFQAGRYAEAYKMGLEMLPEVEQAEAAGADLGDVATFHLIVGRAAEEVGDLRAARKSFETSVAKFEAGGLTAHQGYAMALSNLAFVLRGQGLTRTALELNQKAVDLFTSQSGPNDPDTLVALAKRALILWADGQPALADETFDKVLSAASQSAAAAGSSADQGAGVMKVAGVVRTHKPEKAKELYAKAVAIRTQELGPAHEATIAARQELAATMVRLRDLPGAEAELRGTVAALQKARAGPAALVQPLMALGEALSEQGKGQEAVRTLKKAVAIAEKTHGKNHVDTAPALFRLADAATKAADAITGRPTFKKLIAIVETNPRRDPSMDRGLVMVLGRYGAFLSGRGDVANAKATLRRATAIADKRLEATPDDQAMIDVLSDFGVVLMNAGELDLAEAVQSRVLAWREKSLGDHWYVGLSSNNLAKVYFKKRDYAKARPLYDRALQILLAKMGPEHPATKKVQQNLADLQAAEATGAP